MIAVATYQPLPNHVWYHKGCIGKNNYNCFDVNKMSTDAVVIMFGGAKHFTSVWFQFALKFFSWW